jgi:transposase InsO family protein
MIERISRGLEEECVQQHSFADCAEARAVTGSCIRRYNERRHHQALGHVSPQQSRAQRLQAAA